MTTSALSLARILWWYGEDDLWPRALNMEPVEVADLAPEFARLRMEPDELKKLWPGHPRDAYLLVPLIA